MVGLTKPKSAPLILTVGDDKRIAAPRRPRDFVDGVVVRMRVRDSDDVGARARRELMYSSGR